jgi:hypothetical protein
VSGARPFVVVWREAIAHARDLTKTEKLVAFTLSILSMNSEGGPKEKHPETAHAWLARKCDLSLRAVNKATASLVAKDYLAREGRPGETFRYAAARLGPKIVEAPPPVESTPGAEPPLQLQLDVMPPLVPAPDLGTTFLPPRNEVPTPRNDVPTPPERGSYQLQKREVQPAETEQGPAPALSLPDLSNDNLEEAIASGRGPEYIAAHFLIDADENTAKSIRNTLDEWNLRPEALTVALIALDKVRARGGIHQADAAYFVGTLRRMGEKGEYAA